MKQLRNNKGQFIGKNIKGKNNWNWKGGMIEVKCKNCGKKLLRHPGRIARGKSFCNHKCKGNWMKKNTIGKENSHWKGGIHYDKNGYRMIYKPRHHRAHSNGYVYEHILVLEKVLNKKILRKYDIHHLNGIRDDNRPENLALVNPSEHERNTVRKLLQKRIRELEN